MEFLVMMMRILIITLLVSKYFSIYRVTFIYIIIINYFYYSLHQVQTSYTVGIFVVVELPQEFFCCVHGYVGH